MDDEERNFAKRTKRERERKHEHCKRASFERLRVPPSNEPRSKVRVLYDFNAEDVNELSVMSGETLTVLNPVGDVSP